MPLAPCIDGTVTHQLRIIGSNLERFDIIGCPTPYALTSGPRQTSNIRSKTLYNISSKTVGVDTPGERVTNVRAAARTIVCPVVIHGTTELELEQAIDGLGGLLSAAEGQCRLIWTRADGDRREISGYYESGADSLQIINLRNHRHVEGTLRFKAHSPYWRDWGPGDLLGVGGVLGDSIVGILQLTNVGDVRTWPTIYAFGPCERIELASQTTGQLLRIAEVLSVGQEIRIETDPSARGVFFNSTWQPSALDPIAAEMWPLLPGVNDIVFRAISPGGAGSWRVLWPTIWEGP